MRCYETADGPAIFRLDEHLDRLYQSAAIHGMPIAFQSEELAEGICEFIERNGFKSC
jgi:branched-chain amino acid aminotransferase